MLRHILLIVTYFTQWLMFFFHIIWLTFIRIWTPICQNTVDSFLPSTFLIPLDHSLKYHCHFWLAVSEISLCLSSSSLKASLIMATWSAELFVLMDWSASLSHITDLRLGASDVAVSNVPFVSTFAFFALTVSAVVSSPSELAKIEIIILLL